MLYNISTKQKGVNDVNNEKTLNAQEVALLVGCSVYMLNVWYKWKKLHPEHELAKLLPDYTQAGGRQTRYWKMDDVYKIIEFRQKLPIGRNGILGDVTQKYVKKKEKNDGTN